MFVFNEQFFPKYDTPHGIANVILLPAVMEYNADATGTKYKDIAAAMGVKGTEDMSQEEYRCLLYTSPSPRDA